MKKTTAAVLFAVLASAASAQTYSAEDAIKWRQSAYQILSWNMARLDQNLNAAQFNQDDAIKAANTIAAIANSGMGQLYFAGSDKSDKIKTNVRPEMFTDAKGAAKAAMNFAEQANALQQVAQSGDVAAIKTQVGKLGGTCKGCHDNFKKK